MFASYALAFGLGLAVIGLYLEMANHFRWSKRRKGWGGMLVTVGTMGVVLLLAERVNHVAMATACACAVLALSIRVSQQATATAPNTQPAVEPQHHAILHTIVQEQQLIEEEVQETMEAIQFSAEVQEEIVEELQVVAEADDIVEELEVSAETQDELVEELQVVAEAIEAVEEFEVSTDELAEEPQFVEVVAEAIEAVEEFEISADELAEELQVVEEAIEAVEVLEVSVQTQDDHAEELQVVAVDEPSIASEQHLEEVSPEWLNEQIANGFASKSMGHFEQALQSFEVAALYCRDAELAELLKDEIAECYFSMTLAGGLKVLQAS